MSARDDLRDRLGRGLHEMSNQWAEIEQLIDAATAEARAEERHEIADWIVSGCFYHGPDDNPEGWPDCHCVVTDDLRTRRVTE